MKGAEKLIEYLLDIKAVKLAPKDPFTWASGMRSPIYCDNRISLSYPQVRDHIKSMFVDLIEDLPEFDAVVGVATAGIPHGMLIADAIGKPFAYVRSKAKSHGRQNQIEGFLEAEQSVLVVEDLVSTGMSSLAAIDALKAEGMTVVSCVAIFTYQFDIARENFESAEISLKTLTNYSELIKKAKDSNYITADDEAILRDWNKNPKEWFQNNF